MKLKKAQTEPVLKALAAFSKVAGVQGAEPPGRPPQRAKSPAA